MRSSSAPAARVVASALARHGAWASRAEAQQQRRASRWSASTRRRRAAAGWSWTRSTCAAASAAPSRRPSATRATRCGHVGDGAQRLAVVSDQAFADFGFAVTYDRWRLYAQPRHAARHPRQQRHRRRPPVHVAPPVDIGTHPDTLTGRSHRLRRAPRRRRHGPVSPRRRRAALHPQRRALRLRHRRHLPRHGPRPLRRRRWGSSRTRDTSACTCARSTTRRRRKPARERAALRRGRGRAGPRRRRQARRSSSVPRSMGRRRFAPSSDPNGTALEGLLSGRLEGTATMDRSCGSSWARASVVNHHFGAPEWRLVFAIELFDHHAGP